MRGRRYTNLSTSSSSSTDTPCTSSLEAVHNEKPACVDLELGHANIKEQRPAYFSRKHAFYRCTSILCILAFVGIHCLIAAPYNRLSNYDNDKSGQIITAAANSTLREHENYVTKATRSKRTASLPEDVGSALSRADFDLTCQSLQMQTPSIQQRPSFLSTVVASGQRTISHLPYAVAAGMERSLSSPLAYDPSTHVCDSLAYDPSTHVCDSSLTFSIDAAEASFGRTLLMLWLSYGIAVSEGRAFFVDDSRWLYGRLSTYFSTMPIPKCEPPPASAIAPCPSDTKHVLISASTAQWSLQPRLDASRYSWLGSTSYNHKIFSLLRMGFQSMSTVADEDKAYAAQRVAMLQADIDSTPRPMVGMQIRRGDRHPFELPFSQDYLPLERYTTAAKSLFQWSQSNSTGTILLASDDPDLINAHELSLAVSPLNVQRVQDRIQLATKAALDRESPAESIRLPGSAYVKHVDENTGWDGGFYTSLFHSLGRVGPLYQQSDELRHPSKETMRMRNFVGRSYLLDLEILRHADGVVCGVSSAACRILGVMMGWDAVQHGRWLNVDDGRPWSWNGAR